MSFVYQHFVRSGLRPSWTIFTFRVCGVSNYFRRQSFRRVSDEFRRGKIRMGNWLDWIRLVKSLGLTPLILAVSNSVSIYNHSTIKKLFKYEKMQNLENFGSTRCTFPIQCSYQDIFIIGGLRTTATIRPRCSMGVYSDHRVKTEVRCARLAWFDSEPESGRTFS